MLTFPVLATPSMDPEILLARSQVKDYIDRSLPDGSFVAELMFFEGIFKIWNNFQIEKWTTDQRVSTFKAHLEYMGTELVISRVVKTDATLVRSIFKWHGDVFDVAMAALVSRSMSKGMVIQANMCDEKLSLRQLLRLSLVSVICKELCLYKKSPEKWEDVQDSLLTVFTSLLIQLIGKANALLLYGRLSISNTFDSMEQYLGNVELIFGHRIAEAAFQNGSSSEVLAITATTTKPMGAFCTKCGGQSKDHFKCRSFCSKCGDVWSKSHVCQGKVNPPL